MFINPRKEHHLATHEVVFQQSATFVSKVDMTFAIYSDAEGKIGELHISKGTVDWKPKSAKKAIKMKWEKFDRIMRENA